MVGESHRHNATFRKSLNGNLALAQNFCSIVAVREVGEGDIIIVNGEVYEYTSFLKKKRKMKPRELRAKTGFHIKMGLLCPCSLLHGDNVHWNPLSPALLSSRKSNAALAY